jgi:Ca2+-binding RTX toxin-like protein
MITGGSGSDTLDGGLGADLRRFPLRLTPRASPRFGRFIRGQSNAGQNEYLDAR